MRGFRRLIFLLLLCPLLAVPGSAVPASAAAPTRPNILFFLVDDLDYGVLDNFPGITGQLVRQGASFDQMIVTNSWCCPSRASILRSQYVHSHSVLTNTAPEGGFDRFHTAGLERSTIGTWMKGAGYRTAMMGKYLNHYPGESAPATYVPPGWDEWYVPTRRLYEEYDYTLNENGELVEYGWEEDDYLTDVLTGKAADFVTSGDAPFFLYLAPVAPHNPANPARRHADAFPGVQAPRTPSFNQQDVQDEPAWLRDRQLLDATDKARIDDRYRSRLRAMLGVDDMVATLIETLRRSGKLENTYLFFASDNGFHLGTHRLRQGKTTPFEEAVKVPLVVRGPGVRPGSTVHALTQPIDLAPTFAELGGAAAPAFAEGRSLVPLLRGQTPAPWRRNALIEFWRPTNPSSARQTPVPPYAALRTETHTYVRYDTGETQLYDLTTDPYQLRNLARTAPADLLANLQARLDMMRACSGATCRTADASDGGG
ncbi:sulfatase [Nonomuraea africana]|uniref:Arylsulfatase A-like enzyme n=1 Tax=Nonomuraea africana TaxID=46171 RepID=A0ABR9K7G1_9ACTN|nr:sulfatase [Nonomuraea africana]MBE1557745.1 arylsulfatase A-like enzyme [Nonomuraea africana]